MGVRFFSLTETEQVFDHYSREIVRLDLDISGRVIPVKQGTAAVQDTDSLFHVVGQVRSASSSSRDEVIHGPDLPQDCKLSVS